MLAEILFAEQFLQLIISPTRRLRGEGVEDVLSKGPFVGDVLQQLLIVDLPAQFLAGPSADGAAPGAGLSTNRDRQARRHWGRNYRMRTLSSIPMTRRLGHHLGGNKFLFGSGDGLQGWLRV